MTLSFRIHSILLLTLAFLELGVSKGWAAAAGPATVNGTSVQGQSGSSSSFSGNVSWYGPNFNGKKTASGEIFDMNKPTAAHLELPFGTRVLVEDPRTGKTVIVKVNDRGPYVKSRVMDLSREGARRLGTLLSGVAYVDCLILNRS